MKPLLTAVFFVMMCLSLTGYAQVDLRKFYSFSVPVADQSAQERKRAFQDALKQVLVALSGDRNIAIKETVQTMLQSPERFVKQFRYQREATQPQPGSGEQSEAMPTGDTPQPGQPAPPQPPAQLSLWVQFDENAVNTALKSAGECIWARRQEVLVWLVVEEKGRRSLVSVETEDEFRELLRESSSRRGLPLLFPLYDLQDQMQIRISDIWGNFGSPILKASQRYRTDAILVGRVSRRFGNSWEGQWHLYENNNVDNWTSMGESLEDGLSGGIDGAADVLARRYKERFPCQGGTSQYVMLTVSSVASMRDYLSAQQYLESLQAVDSVSIESIAPEKVHFKVTLRGTPDDLTRSISRDAKMVPVENTMQSGSIPAEDGGEPNALEFRYLP